MDVCCFDLREKDKLKEREEAWMKIDELARKNPDVSEQFVLKFKGAFLSNKQACINKMLAGAFRKNHQKF